MPIYEYECPRCHRIREVIVGVSDADRDVLCELCPKENRDKFYPIMRRVLSAPAPHQVGGVDGKLRSADKVKKRNDAYHRSARGRDEFRANIEAARKRGLPA